MQDILQYYNTHNTGVQCKKLHEINQVFVFTSAYLAMHSNIFQLRIDTNYVAYSLAYPEILKYAKIFYNILISILMDNVVCLKDEGQCESIHCICLGGQKFQYCILYYKQKNVFVIFHSKLNIRRMMLGHHSNEFIHEDYY